MKLFDLFKRVPSISPAEVREYIEHKRPDKYFLLDVRQPAEYERGHLPGALLIPLGDLQGRLESLDQGTTLFVYCRSGNRSLAAASLLIAAGFKKVLNMQGGFEQYNGRIAIGPPEAVMFCFPATLGPSQLVTVAWFLEHGTLKFLERIRDDILSGHELPVLEYLAAERRLHKEKLEQLYVSLTGHLPADFPAGILDLPREEVMVGCIKISDALRWARDKTVGDVTETLMSFSASAFDLYLKLSRAVSSKDAQQVFALLAQEEHDSIKRTARAFEATH